MAGKANSLVFRWCLLFAAGMLLSSAAWSETKAIEMIVSLKNAKTVVVRATPNQEAAAIAFIENGKPILRKGQEETNGFVMVQLADGRTGWAKSAFLVPIGRATVPESPTVPVPQAVPQGTAVTPPANAQVAETVAAQPPALPALPDVGSVKAVASAEGLPQLPVAGQAQARDDQHQTQVEPMSGKARIELWVIGLVGAVGMVIGLVIGGKVGAVYATKSIQERYEMIS